MGTGPQTTTNRTKMEPHQRIEHNSIDVLRRMENLGDRNTKVPLQQIAGFNQDQQNAFAGIRANPQVAQPYYQHAQDYTHAGAAAINPWDIESYLNPYSKFALAGLNEDMGVQNRDLSGRLTRNAGGVGADRIAVGMAEKSRTDQMARGQLMAQFWKDALGQVNNDRGRSMQAGSQFGQLGTGAQNAEVQGWDALFKSGQFQQNQDQRVMDARFAQVLANQEAPWKAAERQGNMTAKLAPALGGETTGTTTTPGTDPWALVAGAGMTGAGLMMGNPMMAAGGMGSMSGGKGGSPGTGYTGTSTTPYGGAPASQYWGGQQFPMYSADGGSVGAYADGGAVNPYDFGLGFAFGGVPDPMFDWPAPQGGWQQDMLGHDAPTPDTFIPPSNLPPAWATSTPTLPMSGGAEPPPFSIPGKDNERVMANAPPPTFVPPPPEEGPITVPWKSEPKSPYDMANAPRMGLAVPAGEPNNYPALKQPASGAPTPPPMIGRRDVDGNITYTPQRQRSEAEERFLEGAYRPAAQPPGIGDFTPRKPQPQQNAIGMRLLEAGLTTLAHATERDSRGMPKGSFAAIGKGGLAALKGHRDDLEMDQKNITTEQSAKKLMEDAKHWRATVAESARGHDLTAAGRIAETSRKTVADANRAVASPLKGAQNWENEDGTKGVMLGDGRFVPGAKISGKAPQLSGTWAGATNATVDGKAGVLKPNGEFIPGMTLSGKNATGSSWMDRAVDRLQKEEGLTYSQAIEKAKNPVFQRQEAGRAETRAAANARADSQSPGGVGTPYEELLEKYRQLEGLPPRKAP